MNGPLLLVDTPYLLYRAFYGLPDSIKGSDRRPVNAILGSVNTILAVAEEEGARAVVCCFGPDAAAYRVELYEGYHAHRPPMPDDLAHQWQRAPDLYRALGWIVLESSDLEADDLLGALAADEASAGGRALILTGDRDLFQCVTDDVTVLLLGGRGKKGPAADRPGRGAAPLRARAPRWCPTSSHCAATPRTACPAPRGSARSVRPTSSPATDRWRPRSNRPSATGRR